MLRNGLTMSTGTGKMIAGGTTAAPKLVRVDSLPTQGVISRDDVPYEGRRRAELSHRQPRKGHHPRRTLPSGTNTLAQTTLSCVPGRARTRRNALGAERREENESP